MNIYPYKPESKSAKDLANKLGVLRIRHTNSRFKGGEDKVVINWGSSNLPAEALKGTALNLPEAVAIASNKLKFFAEMEKYNNSVTEDQKIRVPPHFTSQEEALETLLNGKRVFVRHKVTGHSGEGIEVLKGAVIVPKAPLYVQGIPKDQEYRVHVVNGETFVQRKARRKTLPDGEVNWAVRNHKNGFIFANDVGNVGDVDQSVINIAKNTVKILGLDFGAVDIVTQRKTGLPYVLEVNTACGLSGKTLEFYTEQFKGLL